MQPLSHWAKKASRPAALIVVASLFIVALVGVPDLGLTEDPNSGYEIRLTRYLGRTAKSTGAVDYTDQIQAAINEAKGGTLVLPDYPLLVSPRRGQSAALVIRHPITIRGSNNSLLRIMQGGTQLLRVENTAKVRLEGFSLQGAGGDGKGLAHGLLQVTGARDVAIENIEIRNADADGIAISTVENVRVLGCHVDQASKSGIYLTNCKKALVSNNVVTGFGGHTAPNGQIVGAGIQLSSNSDVVCSDNVVTDGTGSGILCNANVGGFRPLGNVIQGNRIARVSNPLNLQDSSGIRCTNGHQNKATNTLIAMNSIHGCGAYGIYIENHGASNVLGNTLLESERSGLVIGTITDLTVLNNVILNSDVSGSGSGAGILLINSAAGVITRGNSIRNSNLYADAFGRQGVRSTARNSAVPNDLEPRVQYGLGAPTEGHWFTGDRIYNTNPTPGGYLGWVCTSWGTPGQWAPFGRIE